MTTTTDTGLDVQVSNADTGEVYPSEVRAALAATEPTEHERTLLARIDELATENDRLRAELGRWTPRRDVSTITGAADLTERQRNAALVAPLLEDLTGYDDDLGVVPNPIGGAVADQKTWPTWLDELHHQQKIEKERWIPLHKMQAEFAAWVEALYKPRHRGHVSESQTSTHQPRHVKTAELPQRWEWAEYQKQPALPLSAEGEAFLAQGPAPDESMPGRAPDVMDAFNRLHGIAPAEPETQAAGETPTYNETAAELQPGTVRASRWARVVAWIGGATTRRRQTEQDGGA